MSDSLPPLAELSLEEASRYRSNLLRAIASGALSVRNSDGSQVTYRSGEEMEDALTLLDRRIAATVSPPAAPRSSRFYFQTSKGL